MEYVAMKCPNCAGDINYQIGMTTCKCPYCDSTVKITLSDREAIYEQQVIEREAEQKARIEYLEKLRKWKILLRIFMRSLVDILLNAQKEKIDPRMIWHIGRWNSAFGTKRWTKL